jgi:Fe-S-cluster containining protein
LEPFVYALSIHAAYRCRHSGRCCTADWDVPVELPVYRSLSEALAVGRLRVVEAADGLAPFVLGPDLPDEAAAMLERTAGGDCVFFERGSGLCAVHRDVGHAALPATCRHFPRVAVRDRRGTFITLSHFCPTAASMLFRDDVPLAIVANPEAFPPGDYEGLAVGDDDFPPLLHPRMLIDGEGYAAWEAHMVSRCADMSRSPETVLATLGRDARLLRGWGPGGSSLPEAVHALPRDWVDTPAPCTLGDSLERHADAMAAVPPDLRPEPDAAGLSEAFDGFVRPAWSGLGAAINRFIAAKAFASWTAYQGRGVCTIVSGLDAAVSILRVEASRQCRNAARPLDRDLLLEAFRATDFILNHLAVAEVLAERWAKAER